MGMMHRHKVNAKKSSVTAAPKKDIKAQEIASAPDVSDASNTAYSKTDIYRMNKSELVAVATAQGIENAADMSGTDLKAALIEKLA